MAPSLFSIQENWCFGAPPDELSSASQSDRCNILCTYFLLTSVCTSFFVLQCVLPTNFSVYYLRITVCTSNLLQCVLPTFCCVFYVQLHCFALEYVQINQLQHSETKTQNNQLQCSEMRCSKKYKLAKCTITLVKCTYTAESLRSTSPNMQMAEQNKKYTYNMCSYFRKGKC